MQVSLKEIYGPWDSGWVLDKHSVWSEYIGDDEYGHPQFNTKRTEVGEATYQLKYRKDWSQAKPLARALADNIYPNCKNVGLIVPMPATTVRQRQPVIEVANELGKIVQIPVFDNLLLKVANGKSLKNMNTKDDKIKAIGDSYSVTDVINGDGPWNVLVIDDLFHTGASMEAACNALLTYTKVRKIYVAALTWR